MSGLTLERVISRMWMGRPWTKSYSTCVCVCGKESALHSEYQSTPVQCVCLCVYVCVCMCTCVCVCVCFHVCECMPSIKLNGHQRK